MGAEYGAASGKCAGNEGCGGLLAEEDHLSERERIRVCDRELRGSPADLREASRGATMQPQLRRTARLSDDFDVAPQYSLRVSGAERFHRRFLGRKAAGEVNGRIVAPHAVRHLRFSEDAVSKAFAVPFNGRSDPRDIRGVEAESDDVHAPTA